MDYKDVDKIITAYEDKLKRNDDSFKLTPFEKLLMKECLIYGYEVCLKEIKNK